MPIPDLLIGQDLQQGLQLRAGLHISLEFFAIKLMHLMYDGLPSNFILFPPLVLRPLHLINHSLTTFSLQAELFKVYLPDLHLRDLLEEALEGVKLLPVLYDQ